MRKVVFSKRKVVFSTRKAVFPIRKSILLMRKVIFPTRKVVFPIRKVILSTRKGSKGVGKQIKRREKMRKQKARIGFTKYSNAEFAAIAQNVINKMSENPDFPSPTPAISSVGASLKAFKAAIEKSTEGTKQDTAYTNEKRRELNSKLSNLGGYVNIVANGDLLKLDSSGFPVSKPPAPIGILPPPDYIHVADGENHGELAIKISHVPKASGYIVFYSEVPGPANFNDWHSKTFSKTKGILVGLKSATKYVFKAAAMSSEANKLNHYNYTETVARITQ